MAKILVKESAQGRAENVASCPVVYGKIQGGGDRVLRDKRKERVRGEQKGKKTLVTTI